MLFLVVWTALLPSFIQRRADAVQCRLGSAAVPSEFRCDSVSLGVGYGAVQMRLDVGYDGHYDVLTGCLCP